MSSRKTVFLRMGVGCFLAAACLAWVFHGIHFDRLFQNISRMNWGLVSIGLVCDLLAYVCQGFRWHFLLQPIGDVSVWRTTQATYAGLFINEILPMRIGELARAYLVSRWVQADFIRILPSMALERLFEGIWLAAGIGVCAYPAGDLEELSKFVQKKYGFLEYVAPVLIGYSSGATFVYAVLVQAPPTLFGAALALVSAPTSFFRNRFAGATDWIGKTVQRTMNIFSFRRRLSRCLGSSFKGRSTKFATPLRPRPS